MTKKILLSNALAVLLLASAPAHAYLDPGTGSMILQGLIAGIAAGLMVLKLYWYKIKAFFRREHKDKPRSDSTLENADKEKETR